MAQEEGTGWRCADRPCVNLREKMNVVGSIKHTGSGCDRKILQTLIKEDQSVVKSVILARLLNEGLLPLAESQNITPRRVAVSPHRDIELKWLTQTC